MLNINTIARYGEDSLASKFAPDIVLNRISQIDLSAEQVLESSFLLRSILPPIYDVLIVELKAQAPILFILELLYIHLWNDLQSKEVFDMIDGINRRTVINKLQDFMRDHFPDLQEKEQELLQEFLLQKLENLLIHGLNFAEN